MYSRRLLIAIKTHLRAELGGELPFVARHTKVCSRVFGAQVAKLVFVNPLNKILVVLPGGGRQLRRLRSSHCKDVCSGWHFVSHRPLLVRYHNMSYGGVVL